MKRGTRPVKRSLLALLLVQGLLFLVLFYVYPLKFLFTLLFEDWFYGGSGGFPSGQAVMLMYSGGVVGIFGLFALMHAYAYRHRDTLALTDVERSVTRSTIRAHLIPHSFP